MRSNLLAKSETYAREVLENFSEDFHYHDLHHTLNVVQATARIAGKSKIKGDELENLLVAAWFHDLGYQAGMENHEEESVRIMRQKLEEWSIPGEKTREIERLILATRMPHQPTDVLTQIICDADLYHLCQSDFPKYSERLRKEINCICSKNIDPTEWIKMNLEFMKNHRYFTEYGKKVLRPLKSKIMSRIAQMVSKS